MVPSKLLLNEQMNVALSFYSHDIYYYGSYTFFFFFGVYVIICFHAYLTYYDGSFYVSTGLG